MEWHYAKRNSANSNATEAALHAADAPEKPVITKVRAKDVFPNRDSSTWA